MVSTRDGYEAHTQYTGLIVKVKSGERLQMHSRHGCYIHNFHSYGSFIGAFYLPFQAGPAIHLNKTRSTITLYSGMVTNMHFGNK